jgi:hypothetical protein
VGIGIRVAEAASAITHPIESDVEMAEATSNATLPAERAAVDRIITTNELLEAILFRLDEQTLLVIALRVSKHWKTVIDSSPSLQQVIFFRPSPTPMANSEVIRRENPLLKQHFSIWYEDGLWTDNYAAVEYNIDQFQQSLRIARNGVLNSKFKREHASWRHMLLHQPPMHQLGILEELDVNCPFFSLGCAVVECPVGLTMGTLYDLTLESLDAEHKRKFRMSSYPFEFEDEDSDVSKRYHMKPFRESEVDVVLFVYGEPDTRIRQSWSPFRVTTRSLGISLRPCGLFPQ